MKRFFISILIIALFASCGSEAPQKKEVKVEGYAQGTTYSVVYVSADNSNYQRAIDSLLIEIDNSLSTYQKKSVISKFNQADTSYKVDEMFIEVFDMAKQVFEETEGAFDPTIAPVVNAWGFGFENIDNVDSSMIDSLLIYVDFSKMRRINEEILKERNMMLDFNAIAQGYSVDVLCELLESRGVENYLVEVGGEIRSKGNNIRDTLWRVGIDRPVADLKVREIEAIVNMDDMALATSGNYRKFYEKDGMKYAHTINPKTGKPVEHTLLSASVIAKDCAMADAYATAFMVMGLEKSKTFLAEHKGVEALLIYSDENGGLSTFTTKNLTKNIELNPNKN